MRLRDPNLIANPVVDVDRRRAAVVAMMEKAVPVFDEVFAFIEKHHGWFPWIDEFVEALMRWFPNGWAEFYEDDGRYRSLVAVSLLDPDVIEMMKEGKRDEALERVAEDYRQFEEEIDTIKVPETEEERRLAVEKFNALDEAEKRKLNADTALFFLSFWVSLHNLVALVAHARSMPALIRAAKEGSDDALKKAIQVDRTVLYLPFVRERLFRAELRGESDFLGKLAGGLSKGVFPGKIRYRTLQLTFAFLEDEGLLSRLTHEQIFDICEGLGVYGRSYGIEDVGHLSKRLQEWRVKRNSK